jgi:hypothetical protein
VPPAAPAARGEDVATVCCAAEKNRAADASACRQTRVVVEPAPAEGVLVPQGRRALDLVPRWARPRAGEEAAEQMRTWRLLEAAMAGGQESAKAEL